MSLTSSSSVPTAATTRIPHVTEALCLSLLRRAEQLQEELACAQRAFTESPSTRTHGALAFAVAQSQQLLKLVEGVRARRQQERQQTPVSAQEVATTSSSSSTASSRKDGNDLVMPATLAKLEDCRLAFRRALPRAVSVLDEAGAVPGSSGGAAGAGAAADAAASLRSLKHTRQLLAVELKKVDTAVHQLTGAAEAIDSVHKSLDDVHGAMEGAGQAVRRLLAVQSKEDAVLRLSALVFALVVGFVFLQRVFGFFPVVEYVKIDGE